MARLRVQDRYKADGPYTFVADILVALNPYKWIDMYVPRAVQFHPHGGQFDFVWLSARTPHGVYV